MRLPYDLTYGKLPAFQSQSSMKGVLHLRTRTDVPIRNLLVDFHLSIML